jgi:predicted enzyme related to lactoylglutathione lyase
MIAAATHGITGHITSLGHEPHNYVTVYIRVDNIEECLNRIERRGGNKILGPIPIPTGRFAWFSDLEGNMLGLQEPK